MIRSLYPIDLISLLLLPPKAANHAKTRDGLERRSLVAPRTLLEHWFSLRGRRHTWVSASRGRILGLISVRGCFGPSAWRIDCLQLIRGEDCLGLLDRVSSAAVAEGVRKVFLRLHSDSPLLDEARRAGFSTYGLDFLYRHQGDIRRGAVTFPHPYSIGPRSSVDDHALFELYTAVVPVSVRTAEGMTLSEWQESRDRGSWLEQHREFVLHKQGRLVGWLRTAAARGVGCFEIICLPSEGEGLEWLVDYGLALLGGRSPLFCIASAYQAELIELLRRLQFEEVAQYTALLKETALRVKEPYLAPAGVR